MREEELLGSLINVIGVSVEYKSSTQGYGFVWVGVLFGWECLLGPQYVTTFALRVS